MEIREQPLYWQPKDEQDLLPAGIKTSILELGKSSQECRLSILSEGHEFRNALNHIPSP
jgi:hypothetical protein